MIWVGDISRPTGYSQAGRGYLKALLAAGFTDAALFPTNRFRWDDIERDEPALAAYKHRRLLDVDQRVRICHESPDQAAAYAVDGVFNIGQTVWETDKLPGEYRFALHAAFNEIWVPSEFCRAAFERSRVRNVRVMPHAVDVQLPAVSRPPSLKDKYVFLCVGSRNERKNPLAVLRAFVAEFGPDDPVALIYKCWSELRFDSEGKQVVEVSPEAEVAAACAEFGRSKPPPVWAISQSRPRVELLSYYALSDCFVSAHRGEGFGLALLEAKAAGLLVIATGWGGPMDFLDPLVDVLLPHKMIHVKGMEFHPGFTADQSWADPDFDALRAAMRHAFEKRSKGSAAGTERFSPAAVGAKMVAAIRECTAKVDAKAVVVGKPQRRPPVVMVSTFNDRCGIGIYTERLCHALRRRDYPLTCIGEKHSKPDRVKPEMLGFKYERLWERGRSESILAALDAQPIPGILHLQHEFGFWRDGTALTPIIEGAHDRGWRVALTMHTVLPAGLAEEGLFRAAGAADALVALGRPGADALSGWCDLLKSTATVAHIAQGAPDIIDVLTPRRAIGQPETGVLCLCPGFVSKHKRLAELVDAVIARRDRLMAAGFRLLIAGDLRNDTVALAYATNLQKMIVEEGLGDLVDLRLGFVDDRTLHYAAAAVDFAVLNHQSGVLSNSALLRHLQAYGVPVCAADVPSLSDARGGGGLMHDGAEALADNLVTMAEDGELRARLRAEALMAAQTHTFEHVAYWHEGLYAEMGARARSERRMPMEAQVA